MSEEKPVRLRFECVAEPDVSWEITGLQLTERFNEPYQLRLELRTDDAAAEPMLMLGAAITVTIERGPVHRELCGIVELVEDGLADHEHIIACLSVVPALTALAHRKTSRIFQEMTIPEILEEVLNEGLAPFERKIDTEFLSADYPAQEYTVQYRETDLDFVHRLMEEYGICYRFKHENGVETLVLFDSDAAYDPLASFGNGEGILPMVQRGGTPGMREDAREFYREAKLRPTVARTAVFDWLAPTSIQEAEKDTVTDLGHTNGAEVVPEREDYEHDEPASLFGYRTAGLDFAAVENQVKLRRALHQRDAVRCIGMSTATGLSPGVKFEILDHPQTELDGEYVIVAIDHAAGDFANPEIPDEAYTNRFECIPIGVEWRPARQTKRPRMPSMQTATVVGPSGEEIYTDEHGRIKVQFHWDRTAGYDENSSCFIRVVQPWSGNGWGFVWLPRIGMEVAVTFVDGDPDRPIVTGCLYNGANATPYPLPDEKTKSTIKSNSSPGGGGFNELRFEDAAGSEEIYIHAQKDFNEEVLHDHNTTVGNNQTNNVDVDQTQTVHGNQSETVDGNQDMTVGGNRTVHVVGDFTETIDATETRTVTGAVTETFSASETRNITADQSETIGGSVTRTITGSVTENVTGSLTQSITGGVSVTTPAAYEVTAAAGITMTSPAGIKMIAPAGFTVVAPGGTTTVDSFFDRVGGALKDAFDGKVEVIGVKIAITSALALSVINNKVDIVRLKVDINQARFNKQGPELKTGLAVMHQVSLNFCSTELTTFT